MTSIAALGAAAGAIFKRDLLLFVSYRSRIATTFFTTAVSLTLFYYVSRLVHSRAVGSPDDYYAFVVIGLIIFGVLSSTLSTPVSTVRAELQAGTFERLVLSPFGAVRSIAALMLFPLALATAVAAASLVFAAVTFGLDLRWSTAPLAVPIGLLGAAAFMPFGLAMAAAVVVFKQTNAGATFVMTGITLLAGLYFPVALLPDWIRWASEVQPFTPAVDLLRNVLVGTSLEHEAASDLAKLAGFAIVTMPLSLLLLRTAVRLSRRRGTIIEY
ncbi:MAG TPA: ABC transporter permease [Thermoleophilaceae bacterium]|nr:ABC transporter permease [Thermoleophilaceae bacterium]